MSHSITRAAAALGVLALSLGARTRAAEHAIQWMATEAPQEAMITGGPWTLEQSGAAVGRKSAGYCNGGLQVPNPGTERMQPYYFPTVFGHGRHLQGFFDYRPKDTDEAVAAARSDDAGRTWIFQQKVLELRTKCPDMAQADPDGDKDMPPYFDPNNADNGDDDGQGHQYLINIAGHRYLYTLVRSVGHIDSDQLVMHDLTPLPGQPLYPAPPLSDAPADPGDVPPIPSGSHYTLNTQGLFNPDGILGTVPGTGQGGNPLQIIYEQKVLNGDIVLDAGENPVLDGGGHVVPGTYTDPVTHHQIAFSSTTICGHQQTKKINQSGPWGAYYTASPGGVAANHDVTFLRLAETMDGIHFTDRGPLQGLNDPTTTSPVGTRWLATAGTILKLDAHRYGLLFSGGNCIDGDSDAFHYIGYAESSDLIHWTMINGLNTPIASVLPVTIVLTGGSYVLVPNGTTGTTPIPSATPVIGNAPGWLAGRVYAPSATLYDEHRVTVVFAGYHTPKPKNGLGDYRTIGRVTLYSEQELSDGDRDRGFDRDDDSD